MQGLPLGGKNGEGQETGLLQVLWIVQQQSDWNLQLRMADPLQGGLAIFGQFDEHTVGLPLLQSAEESLGGAGTVVANAEDFVHWVMWFVQNWGLFVVYPCFFS